MAVKFFSSLEVPLVFARRGLGVILVTSRLQYAAEEWVPSWARSWVLGEVVQFPRNSRDSQKPGNFERWEEWCDSALPGFSLFWAGDDVIDEVVGKTEGISQLRKETKNLPRKQIQWEPIWNVVHSDDLFGRLMRLTNNLYTKYEKLPLLCKFES